MTERGADTVPLALLDSSDASPRGTAVYDERNVISLELDGSPAASETNIPSLPNGWLTDGEGLTPIARSSASASTTTDGKSSVPAAVWNYVNSIIGSGIIGLPFALKQAGLGAGLVLLVRPPLAVLRRIFTRLCSFPLPLTRFSCAVCLECVPLSPLFLMPATVFILLAFENFDCCHFSPLPRDCSVQFPTAWLTVCLAWTLWWLSSSRLLRCCNSWKLKQLCRHFSLRVLRHVRACC